MTEWFNEYYKHKRKAVKAKKTKTSGTKKIYVERDNSEKNRTQNIKCARKFKNIRLGR